jgi:hypothetical protein
MDELNVFEPTALVPMPIESISFIGLAGTVAQIAGVVAKQPAVVVGATLAGLAVGQMSALPKAAGFGTRLGSGVVTLAFGGLLTWWAMARRAKS